MRKTVRKIVRKETETERCNDILIDKVCRNRCKHIDYGRATVRRTEKYESRNHWENFD